MRDERLAVRREIDPEERRRNALIAIAIFGGLVLLLVVKFVIDRGSTYPVEVTVRGYNDAPLKATVTLKQVGGKLEVRGQSDENTGRYEARVPPGAYNVEGVVLVRETEVGLANPYPQQASITVPDDAKEPVRITFTFAAVEPFWPAIGKDRQFRVHK
jgi:hypothetical protein